MNADGLFAGVDNVVSIPAAAVRRTDLCVVDAADLASRPFVPPEFLVTPILPRTGTVLLSGDTGACKTALMIHVALCVASGMSVGGQFEVSDDLRPILILNGEMGCEVAVGYIQQAAAGIGVTLPRGRVLFEGSDGVSSFRLADGREELEELIAAHSPAAIFFDTQRALFGLDENDTGAVRDACRWLQSIAETHQLVNVLSHHLRKLGPVSNSSRERVAGSRDWIAAVDVHLAATSRDGRPMHALTLGKTRFPTRDAIAGTEWPVECRLEIGAVGAPRSIIAIGEAIRTLETSTREDAIGEMRARLEVEGPLTIEQIGARIGNAKRAYEQLCKSGELVGVGKSGRKQLYGLAGLHDKPELVRANGV